MVQAPITPLPLPTRQLIGTSSANDVTVVVGAVLHDTARERRTVERHIVHQIEGAAKVDRKRLGALADEHLPRAAARNVHVVNELVGISSISWQRFRANVIDRLAECRTCRSGRGSTRSAASRASNVGERVFLDLTKVGIVARSDLSTLAQCDRQRHSTRIDRDARAAAQRVRNLELESPVLDRIAVGIDMDLIDRIGIERVIIGAITGPLVGLVVGDERHEPFTTGLVAPEHVEIGAVNLAQLGNSGSFAVTGREGRSTCERSACHKCQCGKLHQFHCRSLFNPCPAAKYARTR